MTAQLRIDTDALRAAAGMLTDAAAECRTHHPAELPAIPSAALGWTALARETELLVQRRVAQAFELTDGLSRVAEDLAARVLAVADRFERVEALRPVGG